MGYERGKMPVDEELRRFINGLLKAYDKLKCFKSCKDVVKQMQIELPKDGVPTEFRIRAGRDLLEGEDLVKGWFVPSYLA